MSGFRVRLGQRGDCREILRLIKELATYEKAENSVFMTVDVLEADGFGEKPLYRVLVAEELDKDGEVIPGNLIGYALFYPIYSTWEGKCIFLEDLYVTPNHRTKGLGGALFKNVAKICYDEGCKRLQWAVLNWNTLAINFYKKFGAIDLTEKEGWQSYRLDRPGIDKLSQL